MSEIATGLLEAVATLGAERQALAVENAALQARLDALAEQDERAREAEADARAYEAAADKKREAMIDAVLQTVSKVGEVLAARGGKSKKGGAETVHVADEERPDDAVPVTAVGFVEMLSLLDDVEFAKVRAAFEVGWSAEFAHRKAAAERATAQAAAAGVPVGGGAGSAVNTDG